MDGGETNHLKNRNVLVLSSTVSLILLSLYSWYYLFPLYLKELGASDREVGISYALFTLGFTFAQCIGGYLTDRFGRKWVIILPTYFFPIFYLLLAVSKVWYLPVIFYLFTAVGSAIQIPAFTSIIAESTKRKGKAFGLFEFYIALGIAFGPLIGSVLIDRVGIRTLIISTAVTCLIGAILRHIFLVETQQVKQPKKGAVKTSLNRNFGLFLLSGAFLFLVFSISIHGPFMTLFQKESLKFSESRISLLFAIGGILSALSSLLGGSMTDKLGGKKILGMSVCLHPFLLFLWSSLSGFAPFFVISFAFSQFCYIAYQVVITDLTEEETRGRLIGIFGTTTGLISSLGPIIGMQLKIHYGYKAPFYLAFGFGIISFLILQCVKEKK